MAGSATTDRTMSARSMTTRASLVRWVPTWMPVPTTVSEPGANALEPSYTIQMTSQRAGAEADFITCWMRL